MNRSVLLSRMPYGLPPLPDTMPADWHVVPRPSDWDRRGWRGRTRYLLGALSLAREARRHDIAIICTSGIETIIVAGLARLKIAPTSVIAYDFLPPSWTGIDRLLSVLLGGLAAVAVIRTTDEDTLVHRFPSLGGRISFVPFPASPPSGVTARDEGFLYCAGSAHRDWQTAFAAFAELDCEVVVSTGDQVPSPSENVTLVGPLSPSDGQALMSRARAVVVPFVDTTLPHGPLIILDAMTLGKPVVATRTAGSRDYVTAETGILVPPGDFMALKSAVQTLIEDPVRAHAMGVCGQQNAKRLTPTAMVTALSELADSCRSRARARSAPLSSNDR